jgi:hypothetical protein
MNHWFILQKHVYRTDCIFVTYGCAIKKCYSYIVLYNSLLRLWGSRADRGEAQGTGRIKQGKRLGEARRPSRRALTGAPQDEVFFVLAIDVNAILDSSSS